MFELFWLSNGHLKIFHQAGTGRPAYGVLGHTPLRFTDQHMVSFKTSEFVQIRDNASRSATWEEL